MCIRHTDNINDEDKVKTLLPTFTNSIKKVIRKGSADFDSTVLRLPNMKYYSRYIKNVNLSEIVHFYNLDQNIFIIILWNISFPVMYRSNCMSLDM